RYGNYFWRQQGQDKTVRNLVLFCSRSLATEMIFCARRGKIRRPKSDSY
ncbi:MAG: hypothetical protein ACI819_001151, partial [Neolewinella sp.]